MISEEKNAPEPLCSSQAKKLPALTGHVICQAVTPGAWSAFRRGWFAQEGARGTPVTFASRSRLPLSPRLGFDRKCDNRLRGRWGRAGDRRGCPYPPGWERGARGESPGEPQLLCHGAVLEPERHFPVPVGIGTAQLCPGRRGVS